MKKLTTILICCFILSNVHAQVTNTSYVTQFGEKVLQLSVIIPLDKASTWKLFTTEEGLKQWMAPVVKLDMKVGGSIITNYNKSKPIEDSSSIKLNIINYVEQDILTLKVNLNNNFPASARNEDKNLQEVLQFISIDSGKTKVVSNMIGWGKGSDWDKVYTFFERGNIWTFEEMLKIFNK